jgi:multidrug efflux pump subunit AcrA (membrane-fusion protein)
VSFPDLWNSIDRLSRLITLANWGIAASLLLGFAFTVITIKASGRKDELVDIEERERSARIANSMKLAAEANERAALANERAGVLESGNLRLRTDLEHAITESRSKQAELQVEQRKTAEAQQEAAKAQLEYSRYVDEVAKQQKPRGVDRDKFVEALRDKPKRPIGLLYNPNDSEAFWFAQMLFTWLGKGNPDRPGAGWQVTSPKPIPPGAGYQDSNFPDAPPGMRFGGVFTTFGITFRVRNPETAATVDVKTSIGALIHALAASITPSTTPGSSFVVETDSMVQGDDIWVVVGPKPPIFFTPQELNKK